MTKRAKDILKNSEEFPLIVIHMDNNSTQMKRCKRLEGQWWIPRKRKEARLYSHIAQLTGARRKCDKS